MVAIGESYSFELTRWYRSSSRWNEHELLASYQT